MSRAPRPVAPPSDPLHDQLTRPSRPRGPVASHQRRWEAADSPDLGDDDNVVVVLPGASGDPPLSSRAPRLVAPPSDPLHGRLTRPSWSRGPAASSQRRWDAAGSPFLSVGNVVVAVVPRASGASPASSRAPRPVPPTSLPSEEVSVTPRARAVVAAEMLAADSVPTTQEAQGVRRPPPRDSAYGPSSERRRLSQEARRQRELERHGSTTRDRLTTGRRGPPRPL